MNVDIKMPKGLQLHDRHVRSAQSPWNHMEQVKNPSCGTIFFFNWSWLPKTAQIHQTRGANESLQWQECSVTLESHYIIIATISQQQVNKQSCGTKQNFYRSSRPCVFLLLTPFTAFFMPTTSSVFFSKRSFALNSLMPSLKYIQSSIMGSISTP